MGIQACTEALRPSEARKPLGTRKSPAVLEASRPWSGGKASRTAGTLGFIWFGVHMVWGSGFGVWGSWYFDPSCRAQAHVKSPKSPEAPLRIPSPQALRLLPKPFLGSVYYSRGSYCWKTLLGAQSSFRQLWGCLLRKGKFDTRVKRPLQGTD